MDRDPTPDGPEEPVPPPPEGSLPAEPPSSPPRRRRRPVLIAIGALVVAVAGAATWAFVALRGTEDVLVKMVPDDATVYVTGYLDPSAGQKLAVRSLLEKFPQLEDTEQVNDVIDQAIDDGLGDFGLDSADIRVWIGSQIGVAAWFQADAPPALAFLATSKDEEAARRTLGKVRASAEAAGVTWEEETHEGVTIAVDRSGIFEEEQAYALFDDRVVFTNGVAVMRRIIDTSMGVRASLESSASFEEATAPLTEDRLGLLYVDLVSLIEELQAGLPSDAGITGPIPDSGAFLGLGASLSAHSDGFGAEFHVALDSGKLTAVERGALGVADENDTLAFTPQNAFGVMALSGLDEALPAQLNQLRQLPSFAELDQELGISAVAEHLTGDVGLEVGPSSLGPVEGALLIGTDDEAAMQTFLDGLAGFVVQELLGPTPPGFEVTPTTEEHRGVTITTYQVPGLAAAGVAPAYAVSDGMAILGSFPQEVRDILDARAAGGDVRAAGRYRQVIAQVDDPSSFLIFVDVEGAVEAIRTALPPSEQQAFDAEVAQNVESAKGFGMTVLTTEELISLRLFVLIE